MNINDCYSILNINADSSEDEIKQQYRKLARKYHPDLNKSQLAIEYFNEIQEAYNILKLLKNSNGYSDESTFHDDISASDLEESLLENWQQQHNSVEGDCVDNTILDDFTPMDNESHSDKEKCINGDNLHCKLSLTLEELYFNQARKFTLKIPSANFNSKNKISNVKLPNTIVNNQVIRLEGQGMPGDNNGIPGDLLIDLDIKQHKLFRFKKNDIYLDVMLLPWEAALGTVIRVPTLGGMVSVQIPENVQSGQKLRLKGKGLPGKNIGDQILMMYIFVPEITNTKQREFYYKMRNLFNDNPRTNFE